MCDFNEVFPEISYLDITVILSGGSTRFSERKKYHYSIDNPPPEKLRCIGERCTGEFNVFARIRRLLSTEEKEKVDNEFEYRIEKTAMKCRETLYEHKNLPSNAAKNECAGSCQIEGRIRRRIQES